MAEEIQEAVQIIRVALCPFHDDKNYGNFVVSPNKNIYHCFACGQSGDGLTFLMKHEHMSYVDAIKWLANKYYIDVESDGNNAYQPKKSGTATTATNIPVPELPPIQTADLLTKCSMGLILPSGFALRLTMCV